VVRWCRLKWYGPVLARLANLPEGLYILLALISYLFLIFIFYYEQIYLSIYWADFHNLFTKWKGFAWILLIRSIFSDSSRDVSMATNFVSHRTCSLGAEVSQDSLDRFSQSLHRMVGIELQMINTFYFFRYLKGSCYGNKLKWKNWRFYGPIYFVTLPLGNGLQYHNSNFKRLDRMNISTSCAILVTFRPETLEFTLLTIATFVAIWQKLAYHAKYLRMFGPTLTYFTG